MSLMSDIRAFPVPKKSVAIWWLGKSGYIFKTPEGTLVTTDMYLTNSCQTAFSDLGMDLSGGRSLSGTSLAPETDDT
jgi:hypothetical protein